VGSAAGSHHAARIRIHAAVVGVMMLAFGVAVSAWTAAMIMSERSPRHEPDGTMSPSG